MYRCGKVTFFSFKIATKLYYPLFQEKETWADFIWASTMAKSGRRGSGWASDAWPDRSSPTLTDEAWTQKGKRQAASLLTLGDTWSTSSLQPCLPSASEKYSQKKKPKV